ncbi:hypothetical protein FOZ63_005908 [Perkinsus olseni]|uniref:Uncharacterized protein n=1 Tax=Perkinsus olseni TaxID=32597 RepID=A0A7J6QE07_PEROL|nr:hypothetical protein FOZ62_013234 [Perkinsus olseni]KAF4757957.1 hypothetical protein FOZ63_005908 [Perkinsus olseni]
MAFAAGKLRPGQQGPPGLVTQKILRRAGQEAHPVQLSKATKQVLAERVIGKIDARRSSEDSQASREGDSPADSLAGGPPKESSARKSDKVRTEESSKHLENTGKLAAPEGAHHHHHKHKHGSDDGLPPVAEALVRLLQASPYCTVQELSSGIGHVLRKHGAKKSADAFELSMHTAIVSSKDPLPSTTHESPSVSETKQRLDILDAMARMILEFDDDHGNTSP